MPNNTISAILSPADQEVIFDAIAIMKDKLGFAVGLTQEERKGISRMGDKTRAFVSKAIEVATQNAEIMPRCLDVDEMRKDVELVEALYPIMLAISQLQELIEDTYLLAGSEAYAAARMAYNSARANGKAMGLDAAVEEMGRRYSRRSRKTNQSDSPQS
jgi:hypothetical protein